MGRVAAVAAMTWAALAGAGVADGERLFRDRVAPLLATRCGACHGPVAAESGFRIDVRERALAGGDSGAAGIVPGQPVASALFARITTTDPETVMPAEGEPLSVEERALVEDWIAAGAAWPDDLRTFPPTLLPPAGDDLRRGRGHWAFEPVVRPAVPAGDGSPGNPIDAFVTARLVAAGLEPSPEADPRALIRRVTFDLVGLPPSPEEIEAFESACRRDGGSASAYHALVDRLLASPRHGERWARHWLDVVRFAESNGFETNSARPNAWPYRDWVIAALNDDMPYDRFVRAQIAGDVWGADAATGFLVGGPWDQVKSPDPVLTATQRADELHDIVGTTASAFLGLTVGCARCHDHKFDPVSQVDYHRIKAVFAGVQHGERPLRDAATDAEAEQRIAALERQVAAQAARLAEYRTAAAAVLTATGLRVPVGPQGNVDTFPAVVARWVRFTVRATTGDAEPCLDELEVFATDGTNVAIRGRPTASSTLAGYDIHKLGHVNDGRYGNERSWISAESGGGWVQIELAAPVPIERVVWSRDRSAQPRFSDRVAIRYEIAVSDDGATWRMVASDAGRMPHGPAADFAALAPEQRAEAEALAARHAATSTELEKLAAGPRGYVGTFVEPGPTHRLFRGDPMAPREEVPPGGLSQLGGSWELAGDAPEQARRQRLAEWIAASDNPLTARVIVNRLWHHHFGTGIVDTPSDLGVNGGVPSHPELLDWLAAELVESGWRLKHVHRLIVTSRAYRQASDPHPDALAVDALDRLLWRHPPRRLEAEAIRDAILAVSGSLDTRMGGPGFDLFEPNGNYVKVYVTKEAFGADEFRRMVYQSKPSAALDTFFGAFDCPDASQVQPRRTASTTPLQALNMLNGAFLLDQAERFASRVEREAGVDPDRQVTRAFFLALGRLPTPAEAGLAAALVREHGLALACRSLYNANEFITVR
jgi:cytochrome c553